MTAGTSIYLTIQAESHDEFVAKIEELYRGFCRAPAVSLAAAAADHATGYVDDDLSLTLATLAPVAEPFMGEGPKQARRRGRPRKADVQEAAALAPPATSSSSSAAASPSDTPDSGAEAPKPVPAPAAEGTQTTVFDVPAQPQTKDDVRAALNAYVAKHGMPEGRKLVQKVCGDDVLSLSQIPEAKYGAMIVAANTSAQAA